MNRARSSRGLPPVAEELYEAGFRAGYSLGVRYGRKDRSCLYPGVSLVIPADGSIPHRSIIRQLQACTPQPYELMVAISGAAGGSRNLARSPAVRYIQSSDGSIITAVNQALRAARGEMVAVLASGAAVREGWLHPMTARLQRGDAVHAVYQAEDSLGLEGGYGEPKPSSGAEGVIKGAPSCLLIRREALNMYGHLNESEASIRNSMLAWLLQVPSSNRLCCGADGLVLHH
ncbi:glycosyltransferase family A protein [Paenibacillus sp. 7541]|uniref:glycosyltransferase family A protein n=1 Tax=Paenibacillus sp. 7541 TaxID=2026236 RepID=UPI000BA686FA|nr:glycosyltransferase family A protein [Paenibacillus sp. 7541]PAK48863.1 hypothetical protein CHH75_21940 [Paenibacillus sp. 7541]